MRAIDAPLPATADTRSVDARLRAIGDWLRRHQRAIQATQWLIVLVYAALLIVPAALPLPPRAAHIWSNVTLFAQFAFWGVWWPGVLLSTVLVGRVWCGLLCPEGALSEAAARYSRGHAIPRWLMWKGWPVVAFAGTTIYGQMISVYQYPGPALVILGASTVGAVGVGLLWGRNKRVWCRFLCPVTGVFNVLAKLAPVHFRVDPVAWSHSQQPRQTVNCAPLVPIRTMRGAGACHMCGRCSDYRGAVALARRSPNHEIIHVAGDEPKAAETALILFGMLGLAAAAFHWASSDAFVAVKQFLAEWLVDHAILWPLQLGAPWWILTNYPAQNDVMTLLDGAVLLGYLAVVAMAIGGAVGGAVALATRLIGRWSTARFHHLVQGLIPLAACGVFLGLSMTTVSLLRHDGFTIAWVQPLRALLIAGASAWSLWLCWRIAARQGAPMLRRMAAMIPIATGVALSAAVWAGLFWDF